MNRAQDLGHRFNKKRINASLGLRSSDGAWRTIEGYEAIHMVRNKGQVRWETSWGSDSLLTLF